MSWRTVEHGACVSGLAGFTELLVDVTDGVNQVPVPLVGAESLLERPIRQEPVQQRQEQVVADEQQHGVGEECAAHAPSGAGSVLTRARCAVAATRDVLE